MTSAGGFLSRGRIALGILGALLLAAPAVANAAAPVIPQTSFAEVTETSASLQGSVAPSKSNAEAHFEYVDQATYEASGFAAATKTNDVKVPLSVSGEGDLVGPVSATGDLTENSALITNVNVTSGSFTKGQPVSGENIPPGASVKAISAGSLELNVPVEAGKSKAGVEISGAASAEVSNLVFPVTGTFVPGQTISGKNGKGIKAGTSIVAVGASSMTLSQPATETLKEAELTATATITQGTGSTEEGGVEVLHVLKSTGTFFQGQVLTGAGIRPGTTITQVSADEEPGKVRLTISRAASADAEAVDLAASSPQPIAISIGGLNPQTPYHLRIVARDAKDAEAIGPEVIFFTQAPPPLFPTCPNDVFRGGELSPFGSPSAHLPDCRSYEQATPVNKDGGDVLSDIAFAKAGADGNSVVFGSTFGAPDAQGAQELPFFLASRGKGDPGWSSRGLQAPAHLGEKGNALRGWSPDFSRTFASAIRLTNPITEAVYELPADGGEPKLVAPYAPVSNDTRPFIYAGASADGSVVLFESRADLLSNSSNSSPPVLYPGGASNLYAWQKVDGTVSLAGTMNTETETAALLSKGAHAGPYGWVEGRVDGGGARSGYYLFAEHAIADDGSVFFTSASDGQLYQRLNPTQPQSGPGLSGYVEDGHCTEPDKACTIHISATQKTNGIHTEDGSDPAGRQPAAFMAASADGKTAFFTSSEKLNNDANTGPEQLPAQIGAADLSEPDPEATKNESFLPTHAIGLAIDPSGEYIYWVDPSKNSIGRAKLNPDGSHGAVEDNFVVPGSTKAITYPKSQPGVYHLAPSQPRYLAVDSEYVYWTNTGPPAGETTAESQVNGGPLQGGGTIGRARIDGSGPEPVQSEFITGATNPQGIAINDSHVFWTNAGTGPRGGTRAIGRAITDGGEVEQSFIPSDAAERPRGIALTSSRIYFSSDSNSSGHGAFIISTTLEGTDEKFLFIGEEGVRGVATDSEHAYWATTAENTIGRTSLALTPASEERAFISPDGQPNGLALAGTGLYYSTNGESPPNPGNDLYRYQAQASPSLEDLTPRLEGNGAEVQGVLGASADGSYLYFVANGVLDDAEKAEPGDCRGLPISAAGKCNLYLWHQGSITFIAEVRAAIDSGDGLNWTQTPNELTATASFDSKASFVSQDGRTLLFRAVEPLTGYENGGVPEFYLFRVGRPLVCVTCNPSGSAPHLGPRLESTKFPGLGPVAGGASRVASRHLSLEGNRVFFETTESLVTADTNGQNGCPLAGTGVQQFLSCSDVYEWEAPGSGTCKEHGPAYSELNKGCIYLISTGRSAYPSFFIDASESGDDVFFMTRDSLVGQDGDQITDIYDARVDGGLASQNVKPTPPCEIEGCLPDATAPPPLPAPPNISGPPDPKPKRCKGKKCHKKKHGHKKHHRTHRHRHHRHKASR
jgi:hypothetical protein